MALTKVTYSMISGAVVNALDFNADPTGATSSSTAIQNAIASLVTSGGTVFLPAGTYNIATVISVTASNISLVGEPGTVVEITGAAIHNAFEFTACTNIVVSDLRFEWNGASLNTNNPGWENNYALSFKPNPSTFASCNNVTIENCYFNECASMVTWRIDAAQEVAIAADADKRYYNFKFVNNTVACTLNSGPYAALDATYLDRYQISGNLFQSNSVGYSGIRQTGAGAVGGGNQYSSKGLITNNRIISSRWGIYVGAANNILIADNVLDGQENESIDFEGCSDCTANANRLNNVKYAFALFYYYKNIKISNNHVSLVDTADYFLNHSPVGVTTGYGDLVVSDNWAQCSGGSVYFQLQNGHHINIKNNEFRNVVYTATSNFYSLEMSNNTWTWDRTNPSAAAWLILPADLNTSYQSGYIRITNNEFIATTPLSINCILLFANQTFANEFYIMNNLFMNVAYPVSYDSAAPNRANNRTLFFDNVIEGETSPFAIGAGNPTAEFIFKGLVNRSGLSVFDNPTDFVNTVGTGGCGLGSTFNRNPPASGQVWGWVNTSNTGTPTWTAIATLP